MREILGALADAHGNQPRLQALLVEYDKAVEQ